MPILPSLHQFDVDRITSVFNKQTSATFLKTRHDNPVIVRDDAKLTEAIETMETYHTQSLPVYDHKSTVAPFRSVCGLFDTRDVAVAMLALYAKSPDALPTLKDRQIMANTWRRFSIDHKIHQVRGGTFLLGLLDSLKDHRRVLVVPDGQAATDTPPIEILGVISQIDAIRILAGLRDIPLCSTKIQDLGLCDKKEELVYVKGGETVATAFAKMITHNISGVPVCTNVLRPDGAITLSDIKQVAKASDMKAVLDMTCTDFIKKGQKKRSLEVGDHTLQLSGNDTFSYACRMLAASGAHRVFIVDFKGEVTGALTCGDIISHVVRGMKAHQG